MTGRQPHDLVFGTVRALQPVGQHGHRLPAVETQPQQPGVAQHHHQGVPAAPGQGEGREVHLAVARSASHLTTGPGPTDPPRPTRGSSGDSPRSVSTTPPSRRPVPGSTSATSSSPIHASVPRSLVVDVVNIVERRAARQPPRCAVFGCHKWEIYGCHQHPRPVTVLSAHPGQLEPQPEEATP